MFKRKLASYAVSHTTRLKGAALALALKHGKVILADLVHAIRTKRSAQIMIALLFFCVLFWKLPAVSFALYPFKLFVTMVHESAHALAALVTGGSVASISIAPDESGLTYSSGGFRPLVASAGYTGTSLFGGLLIWLGRKPEAARTVLYVLGGTLLALTILFGRGEAFSVISMALISLAILLVAKKASIQLTHLFLMMLAVICAIEAAIDFQVLLRIAVIPDAASDARTMAMLTHIPRTIWTLFFGFFSMTVLFLSFWISYRPTASNKEVSAQSRLLLD